MRRLVGAASLFAVTWLCLSCEGILEKEPLGQLELNNFFNNPQDAVQAINAAYKQLTFSNENNNFYWAFGVVASDEAIAGGDGSRPGITEIDVFTHTPRTEEFNDYWKLNYAGITQCNTVLTGLEKANLPGDLKSRISGEARFLRAFYHFQLAQVFGDVPVITALLSPSEMKVSRRPRSEVLAQVVKDCEEAATVLPVFYASSETGRVTRGAALALAAKAHLYARDWARVLEKTSQVKALGIYDLVANYQDNFSEQTQNNRESVFEIQHTNLEFGVGNSLNQWWASKKFSSGYGFAEVSEEFVNAFELNDPRLRFTVARNNEPYFGLIFKPSFSSTRYGVRKFLQADSTTTQKADGDINYAYIRFAEVLLWEAEALAELGRVQEALAPLERVRARARAQSATPATTLPRVVTTDKVAFLEALRRERMLELGFECHRFFDLVRWGLAPGVLGGFKAGKHEVFPIPQTEMDLNPALVQNPGY
ncbi:MAG: RagB/SusD family nutrient uptake outer membrane protein [Saprospiraceae bacterium]|jgi:hypothetical protein